MTNLYANQANLYNQAAQAGWANFGEDLSGLAYLLGRRSGKKESDGTPETSTDVNWGAEDMTPLPESDLDLSDLNPWG